MLFRSVAATNLDDGVISPGGIGYDINCGIRLLKTDYHFKEISNKIEQLSKEIYKTVPSGVGKGGKFKFDDKELDKVLEKGCIWAKEKGYANGDDLKFIESNGSLSSAESSAVSKYAKDRGRDQLGTLGSGNHFIEIDIIQNILDKEAAEVYGLFEGQIVIQIHTGSRGLGHQVASDYIKTMISAVKKYGIVIPDKELSCVPISSPEGKSYFAAMSASANYAWANRQLITYEVREAMESVFGKYNSKLNILYDVAHNIAKKIGRAHV